MNQISKMKKTSIIFLPIRMKTVRRYFLNVQRCLEKMAADKMKLKAKQSKLGKKITKNQKPTFFHKI